MKDLLQGPFGPPVGGAENDSDAKVLKTWSMIGGFISGRVGKKSSKRSPHQEIENHRRRWSRVYEGSRRGVKADKMRSAWKLGVTLRRSNKSSGGLTRTACMVSTSLEVEILRGRRET